MTTDIQPRLFELLPHRPPMLLLNEIVSVSATQADALVSISANSSFFLPEQGVPAVIGLEYMGQTAALIAGLAQVEGASPPQLGFLLGSRHYQQHVAYFLPGQVLQVSATEGTLVGTELANFHCQIRDHHNQQLLCEGTLSVLRKPLAEAAQ